MNVKLRDAVYETVTEEKNVKPALYASMCECCGEIFSMNSSYFNECPSSLNGIFNTWEVFGPDGKGLGNMFEATVCSFKCAHNIFEGGWKKIFKYKPYVEADAKLLRCKLSINLDIKYEDELIKEWESKKSNDFTVSWSHLANGQSNLPTSCNRPGSQKPSFKKRLMLAIDILLFRNAGRKYFND